MSIILTVAQYISAITGIISLLILIVKPLREFVLGTKLIREGQKSLLRDRMSATYYKNHKNASIRQYEYENFMSLYKAYKAMGGNSFIDHIKAEVEEWEVTQ